MKRALTILVLLVSSRASEATNVECVDYFLFSNLNLSYCSRYCYRADTEMLYYKGLAEVLSTYIDRRREEGMLQAKKLGIKIDLIEGPFAPTIPRLPRSVGSTARWTAKSASPTWVLRGEACRGLRVGRLENDL